MKFEWDNAKAAMNRAKHAVEFPYAARAFLDPDHIVVEDGRKDYGEKRYHAFGMVEERLYVIAYTLRGGAIRIISARKGNSRDEKKYDQLQA